MGVKYNIAMDQQTCVDASPIGTCEIPWLITKVCLLAGRPWKSEWNAFFSVWFFPRKKNGTLPQYPPHVVHHEYPWILAAKNDKWYINMFHFRATKHHENRNQNAKIIWSFNTKFGISPSFCNLSPSSKNIWFTRGRVSWKLPDILPTAWKQQIATGSIHIHCSGVRPEMIVTIIVNSKLVYNNLFTGRILPTFIGVSQFIY